MYEKPLPVVDAETKPFWDAAKAHQLALQQCGDCGKYNFYPRALCPACHGDKMEWKNVSGEGTIHTFTVARRAASPLFKDDVPYVIALVDLKEGARMMSQIVTPDVDSVAIGQQVKVVFDDVTDEITMPRFEVV